MQCHAIAHSRSNPSAQTCGLNEFFCQACVKAKSWRRPGHPDRHYIGPLAPLLRLMLRNSPSRTACAIGSCGPFFSEDAPAIVQCQREREREKHTQTHTDTHTTHTGTNTHTHTHTHTHTPTHTPTHQSTIGPCTRVDFCVPTSLASICVHEDRHCPPKGEQASAFVLTTYAGRQAPV